MRLVLVNEGWWWVECLCGADTCKNNPLQEPFLFDPLHNMSKVIRKESSS